MDNDELRSLCATRQSNKEMIAVLEAETEKLNEQIGAELGNRSARKVDLGDYVAQIVVATRHTLDKMALVQAGVPVETIEACTKESHSEQLRVEKRKLKG